ncbi:MAG: MoxR family ATPase, partial [Phycisphaerales bacterium]|nr:MoxR family ATPase [Phycisphaerales bacterium]
RRQPSLPLVREVLVTDSTNRPNTAPTDGLLSQLGIHGFHGIEPVILAALAGESTLLLIGAHGTGKSLLLCRIAAALSLEFRHYNASLLNFDDLVGYPTPGEGGTLEFIETPASVWPAEAVFLDEISRARIDMQNRFFSLIHERRVQGIAIERLRYRWAAMNPPGDADGIGDDPGYLGSEPLDPALADRFEFVVPVPRWADLSPAERTQLLDSSGSPSIDIGTQLLERLDAIRQMAGVVNEACGEAFTTYVQLLLDRWGDISSPLSGRRARMIREALPLVHAARLSANSLANTGESVLLTVRHMLPQRADGKPLPEGKILAVHAESWNAADLEASDPRRLLAAERDPIRRGILAIGVDLPSGDRSAYVSDALASCHVGAREALALHFIDDPKVGDLNPAVLEQIAVLAEAVRGEHDLDMLVVSGSKQHGAIQAVNGEVVARADEADTGMLQNLLHARVGSGDIDDAADVVIIADAFANMRDRLAAA